MGLRRAKVYIETIGGFGQKVSDDTRLVRIQIAPKEPAIPGRALGVSLDELTEYDSAFGGGAGARFKSLVAWAAKEVDINPGLLAANLLAEHRRGTYLMAGKVDSFIVGTDDFFERRHALAKAVPVYARVKWDRRSMSTDVNELDRRVVTIQFDTGRDAALASAVYLKYGETRLRAAGGEAGRDFDQLAPEIRFTLIRRAFNAGLGRARQELAEVLTGKDVLVRNPRVRCTASNRTRTVGRRCATIRAAQALHLSKRIFGVEG